MATQPNRGTKDPRAYRPAPILHTLREVSDRVDRALRVGHEEATNHTVSLNETTNGQKALRQLAEGDDKAYRAAMRRKRKDL